MQYIKPLTHVKKKKKINPQHSLNVAQLVGHDGLDNPGVFFLSLVFKPICLDTKH